MTELARSQIAGALSVPAATTISSLPDPHRDHHTRPPQTRADTDSSRSEVSGSRTRPDERDSFSHSDSLSSRRPKLSGGDSSSHPSPLLTASSSDQRERRRKDGAGERRRKEEVAVEERRSREKDSSSVEDDAPTGADDSLRTDSITSMVEEKADSNSVATESSLKFDESMTEDEIEERSFRSLLPSEAHRRGTLDKKPRPRQDSEEEPPPSPANHNRTLTSPGSKPQDVSRAFSGGGQDSFSQFTMDMVRQYMKDEEVRLQHQSSLLHLRQRALKEKTRTELAWLEHQKRSLRDKGQDDRMPPLRKKQRGLLLKMQQEQAEIRRLQEANKAARKERQLLLKQQEEIERMRSSTHRLKERLRCAGGEAPPPETPMSETPVSDAASPVPRLAEGDVRSPSPPLSVSGSETSSIMQKLKKMRSHMDEKFLTKREQQLMQRRRHAEELLEWKQRLDREEAQVRRMEEEALAQWDHKRSRDGSSNLQHHSPERRTDSEKECVSEGDYSSATPDSSIHTERSAPSTAPPDSAHSSPNNNNNYTQDFTSASPSPSKPSVPAKGSSLSLSSPAPSPSNISAAGNSTKMQLCAATASSRTPAGDATDNTPTTATQTEAVSDQSDIESRIRALKEELRKRKSMATQLKREQRKRNKERLKAQEASLLKQLESYNDFIEKTKAELSKEPDATPVAKPQIKAPSSTSEKPRIKPPATHSTEDSRRIGLDAGRTWLDSPLDRDDLTSPGRSRSTSLAEEQSDEDPPTVTPTPVYGSPERPTSASENLSMPASRDARSLSGQSQLLSNHRSVIEEELEVEAGYKSEDQHSECLLKLDRDERQPVAPQKLSVSAHVPSSKSEEHRYSPSLRDVQMTTRELSQEVEGVKSPVSLSSKSRVAAADTSTLHDNSASSNGRSYTPDSVAFSSKKEPLTKDAEASHHSADGYHDDFESSAESSPRENRRGSMPTSPDSPSRPEIRASKKDAYSRSPAYDSQDEDDEVEEDIAEELSDRSAVNGDSHHSGRLLELHSQTNDSRENNINANYSPGISPSQSPLSPVPDQMPGFNIGDRVLVSNVQPGTLKFKGPTKFANGFWAGVELDKSEGSNDGTYDGVAYFECEERHGIFAPPDKITRLPEKYEAYEADTTEDDDSFFDDLSDKDGNKRDAAEKKKPQRLGRLKTKTGGTLHEDHRARDEEPGDEVEYPTKHQNNLTHLASHNHLESGHPVQNGGSHDIMLELDDVPSTLLISDMDKLGHAKQSSKALAEENDKESGRKPTIPAADSSRDVIVARDPTSAEGENDDDRKTLGTFADKLLSNFIKDAVKQVTEIKKAKERKITTANQMNGELFSDNDEEADGRWSVAQKDGLPFFLEGDREELSSPELCNRTESPVLGPSGQEELAKRLAELELSRELPDDLVSVDDQDWFDEDFGLSSRREQQRREQKRREEEERLGGGGGGVSGSAVVAALSGLAAGGEHAVVKTPPRPELPLPLPPKLPEQPAMVVPHSAGEVERLAHAATREIWDACGLVKQQQGGTAPTLAGMAVPKPSQEYLGKEASGQDQEALCIRSYRQAVFDLTWEVLQEVYAEDPTVEQPQWVKPRRVSSSHFHKVKTAGDITTVQEFVATEVLKLYGLKKDHNHKSDWQKMLKFGRKKRDRVDHILVQELHEEESQWVNYDEDELFVKMQLADSILDMLLKDTADALTHIYHHRAKRDAALSS